MLNKYLVEFLGTFFFLFVIIYTGNFIAIGAALALVIYLGENISGGNFNPAVSIMMVFAGKIPMNELTGRVSAQILGGLAAFGLYSQIRKMK
jgi:aquaporin Z